MLACRRVGEDGEARRPGLYREPGGPVLVYAGEGPDAAAVARHFDGGPPPLLVGGAADPNAL